MTYATIHLLHELLEEHLDTLEDRLQDAERALDDTIAANENAAREGDQKGVQAICDAVSIKEAVSAELKEATAAMKDFEKHDWK